MNNGYVVQEPQRLDRFLAKELLVSRNQVESAIKNLQVSVDGKFITKTGYMLKTGQQVYFEPSQINTSDAEYEVDFDVEVIYEDDYLMVLNKPYDLTVHGAPSVKEATLVDWLKKRGVRLSTLSGEERHGIVHRLDKGTSGAIIIAKDNLTHEALSKQLEEKKMGRYYLAIIDLPLKENCIVEGKIGRNPNNRLKMAIVPDGKEAKTAFMKLALCKNEKLELITAKLFTGRTHQIRVHLATLSRHILGDSLYGFKGEIDTIKRFFLHAYCIYFEHPKTKELLYFEAKLKEDMQNFIHKSFNLEDIDEKINKNYIIGGFNSFA